MDECLHSKTIVRPSPELFTVVEIGLGREDSRDNGACISDDLQLSKRSRAFSFFFIPLPVDKPLLGISLSLARSLGVIYGEVYGEKGVLRKWVSDLCGHN